MSKQTRAMFQLSNLKPHVHLKQYMYLLTLQCQSQPASQTAYRGPPLPGLLRRRPGREDRPLRVASIRDNLPTSLGRRRKGHQDTLHRAIQP